MATSRYYWKHLSKVTSTAAPVIERPTGSTSGKQKGEDAMFGSVRATAHAKRFTFTHWLKGGSKSYALGRRSSRWRLGRALNGPKTGPTKNLAWPACPIDG